MLGKGFAIVPRVAQWFHVLLQNRTKKEKQAIQTHFTDLHQFLDKEETFLVTRLEMLTKEIIKKKADYAAELTDALALYDGFIYEMEEKCKQPADEFLNVRLWPKTPSNDKVAGEPKIVMHK